MAEAAQIIAENNSQQEPIEPIKISVQSTSATPAPVLAPPNVPAVYPCQLHQFRPTEGAASQVPSPHTAKTVSMMMVPGTGVPAPVPTYPYHYYPCQPQPPPMATQSMCPCMMMMMSMMNHQMHFNPYFVNQQQYGHQMGYMPPGMRQVRPPWF